MPKFVRGESLAGSTRKKGTIGHRHREIRLYRSRSRQIPIPQKQESRSPFTIPWIVSFPLVTGPREGSRADNRRLINGQSMPPNRLGTFRIGVINSWPRFGNIWPYNIPSILTGRWTSSLYDFPGRSRPVRSEHNDTIPEGKISYGALLLEGKRPPCPAFKLRSSALFCCQQLC